MVERSKFINNALCLLYHISIKSNLTKYDLKHELEISKTSAYYSVDSLIDEGLVYENESGFLSLTYDGKDMVYNLMGDLREVRNFSIYVAVFLLSISFVLYYFNSQILFLVLMFSSILFTVFAIILHFSYRRKTRLFDISRNR
jgi:hypothetical protein